MIALIAAMTRDRVIGKDNRLPWKIPEDMKHFKKTTEKNVVVMGRKTFESMGGPLPNRENIVISTTMDGACRSVEEALEKARTFKKDIFVIGGGKIYEQAIKYADKLCISWVKGNYEGDTYFPEFEDDWQEESKEEHDEFDLVIYRKREAKA